MDKWKEMVVAAQFEPLEDRVQELEKHVARISELVQPLILEFEIRMLKKRGELEKLEAEAIGSEELSRLISGARGVMDE